MTNIIKFDGFDSTEIRTTEDGRFSVFDVIKFCGQKNPWEVWKRLCNEHSEVLTKCDNFKFPGKGQRQTPVADRAGILQIIGLLPGAVGRSYREAAAKVFIAYLDASPELAGDIIDRATPEDLRRIEKRLQGKKIRVAFTHVLQDHGVQEGGQFGACTNAIYRPLLGADAKTLRDQRGLVKKDNVRDSMTDVELAAVMLAESLATQEIESNNRQGFYQCRDATSNAASRVKRVFED